MRTQARDAIEKKRKKRKERKEEKKKRVASHATKDEKRNRGSTRQDKTNQLIEAQKAKQKSHNSQHTYPFSMATKSGVWKLLPHASRFRLMRICGHAYAMHTQCIRNAYAMHTQCIRNAYAMHTHAYACIRMHTDACISLQAQERGGT